MHYAGIDIGSRTVKLIVIDDEANIINNRQSETTFNPLKVAKTLLEDVEYDLIVATGYGRHLFSDNFSCGVISEIKAFGLGVHSHYSNCTTILDIGGQDIKTTTLLPGGKIGKFEMNDRCSAGTGRFLEIMAMALGTEINDFGDIALSVDKAEQINSMCTVFAESEVISLLGRGAKRENVALGIHQAVVIKSLAMLKRVMVDEGDLLFVGGVALNNAIVKLLIDKLNRNVIVPKTPQIYGALGAAISLYNNRNN